jgi:PPOX class probable F420-dependent enzyme
MTTSQSPIPESHADILNTTAFAHIATVGPRGEPQSSPVWFDWDGQYFYFSQTKTRQKLHNLEREPRLAISLLDPNNPYRYLEIRGKVVRVDEDPNLDFINKMAQKYLGQEKYPWHRPEDQRVVVVVEPQHTTKMG